MMNIETIIKMNLKDQNQNLRFFARVDLDKKIEILKIQKVIFHKMKNHFDTINNEILTLSSLILAIDKIRNSYTKIDNNLVKFKIKNLKSRKKRDKLLTNWSVIEQLRVKENMSFREISKYMKMYHKFEVSYSFIFQLWNDINSNKGNKKNG